MTFLNTMNIGYFPFGISNNQNKYQNKQNIAQVYEMPQ